METSRKLVNKKSAPAKTGSETSGSGFSSKLGFVLAAAASAVGLGNIWRFPYLAAKYGGGTFLLIYILLAVTFGFSLMVAEVAIGRKTGKSPIGAFKMLNKKFAFVGVLASLVPAIIFPYYSVIGGWVLKYVYTYGTGHGALATGDSFFNNFITSTASPLVWLTAFIVITTIVVIIGVEKGIEKLSVYMMPVLIVLILGISLYSLTLPGALEGAIYYIKPDFSNFSFMTVLAATGQLFFSMSLAMGVMVTYGSYMKKDNGLESSVRQIELFDTGIAFLAGLLVIPAVFAFSGADGLSAGPGLMFITLPKVFASMPAGNVIGAVFFILVFFAAFTSAVSIMETVVATCMERFQLSRKTAAFTVAAVSLLIAVPTSLGFGALDFIQLGGMSLLDLMDFASNSIMMPIVAILTCVLVGYVLKPQTVIQEVRRGGLGFKSEKLFVVMIKFVTPVLLLAVLVSSVLSAFGVFSF